jgi:hypothetical protein
LLLILWVVIFHAVRLGVREGMLAARQTGLDDEDETEGEFTRNTSGTEE